MVLNVVMGLVLVGRDVSDCRVEALVVEPVDPFRGGEFDVSKAVSRLAGFDQLRLVETDLGLHERVVQSIAAVPIVASMPASSRCAVNANDVC